MNVIIMRVLLVIRFDPVQRPSAMTGGIRAIVRTRIKQSVNFFN